MAQVNKRLTEMAPRVTICARLRLEKGTAEAGRKGTA
jgi:hypothetical protein